MRYHRIRFTGYGLALILIELAFSLATPVSAEVVLCESFLRTIKAREGTCKRWESQIVLPVSNASTECVTGELLDGDGNCIPTPVDTDTNAASLCAEGEVLLGGSEGGKCSNIFELFQTFLESRKTVFVTSLRFTGDLVTAADDLGLGNGLSGLAAGDAICNHLAQEAGLSGTYMAWLSDGTEDPNSRFATQATFPYVMTNGDKIADNYTDLADASLDQRIHITETGTSVNPSGTDNPVDKVRTGTRRDGSSTSSACNAWTSSGSPCSFPDQIANCGVVGSTGALHSGWTERATWVCSSELPIYCVQQ